MVLAETAAQVAVAEKHVADTQRTADCRLLAPVRGDGGDVQSGIGPAETGAAGCAVDAALPAAQIAGAQGEGADGCWHEDG